MRKKIAHYIKRLAIWLDPSLDFTKSLKYEKMMEKLALIRGNMVVVREKNGRFVTMDDDLNKKP